MIHDTYVEVRCDGEGGMGDISWRCFSRKMVEYDTNDKAIEKKLEEEHKWIVSDGKHYCSEDCKDKTRRMK